MKAAYTSTCLPRECGIAGPHVLVRCAAVAEEVLHKVFA
jgi:hypothetical protein